MGTDTKKKKMQNRESMGVRFNVYCCIMLVYTISEISSRERNLSPRVSHTEINGQIKKIKKEENHTKKNTWYLTKKEEQQQEQNFFSKKFFKQKHENTSK